jgi:GT2 family glycosyltransferase
VLGVHNGVSMLESSGSPSGPSATDSASTARAVAFVQAVEGVSLSDTVLAVESQVYEVESIVVIGGGSAAEGAAAALGVDHAGSVVEAMDRLGQTYDLVWFIHGDAVPRPDALGALVFELQRNDASMVGSKILDAAHPQLLESVGAATDVFGEPYTGLDPDEVDLEQYDVVRDVSFVSGVSVLIRRDLLRGLRGIDVSMPPVAAGMDLSHRARIAGGRVMVAPSSEVLHHRTCGHDVAGWRELAGRMRAMWKAYRLITLLWVVPVGTLLGLFDGFVRLFLGQVAPLSDYVRAIGWNVMVSPSTLARRNQLRRVRQARDEELFRYQVAGSLRLRRLATDLGERFGWVIDDDAGIVTEDEMADESTAAGPLVAGVTLGVLFLAARSLWFGSIPAVGYSLPSASELASVLGSWAGGWNPAGLGSSDPTHPSVAISAAVEWSLGGWSGTRSALTVAAMVLGVLSLGRLLRVLGIDGPSRHLAGIVLFLGGAAAAIARSTDWAALIAMGPAVWLLGLVVLPWPRGIRRRAGRLAAITVAAVLTGFLAPLLPLGIAAAGLLAWALVPSVRSGALIGAAWAALAGFAAVSPYLLRVTPDAVLAGGPQLAVDVRSPGWVAMGVVAVIGAVAGRWRLVAWGSVLGFGPIVAFPLLDWGGDGAVALAALAAAGSAIVVGAALHRELPGGRTVGTIRTLGAIAALVVVVLALGPVLSGRAGMPSDEWTDRLDFVSALRDESGPARTLLISAGASLPGDTRQAVGHQYRVISGAIPTADQARLPELRSSDDALAAAVTQILEGGVVRPGSLLAPYAIRWVVVIDDAPVAANLITQIDLVPVPVAEGVTVFRNDLYRPRVSVADGSAWVAGRTSATGPPTSATVRLADSASGRWSPGWSQSDWYNVLSGSEGEIHFQPEPTARALAWIAPALLLLGGLVGVWGRERW